MRPRVTTRPVVGCRMPLTICSSVLLPQPFGPTRLSVSPFSTSKPMSLSAQKSVWRGCDAGQELAQAVGRPGVEAIELGDVLNQDQLRL